MSKFIAYRKKLDEKVIKLGEFPSLHLAKNECNEDCFTLTGTLINLNSGWIDYGNVITSYSSEYTWKIEEL